MEVFIPKNQSIHPSVRYLFLLFFLGAVIVRANAQTTGCQYQSGNITVNLSGQNTGINITSYLLLTDNTGIIKYASAANSMSFANVVAGTYNAVAVTFDITQTVPKITIGANINAIGEHGETSAKSISVCNCNNTTGNLSATVSGQSNSAGQIIKYVLTNENGKILTISTIATFNGISKGVYNVYTLSYDTSCAINNLAVNNNIAEVTGNCLTISAPAGYVICCSPPPVPIINVIAPTNCSGETLKLTVTNCSGSVTWNTGASGSALTVKNLTSTSAYTTNYTATCTLASGCSASSTSNVTINYNPKIVVNNRTICTNSSTTLTATGCPGTVWWHTGASGSVLTINNLKTTTSYTATCTLNTGCQASAVGTVTVNPTPTITANSPTICSGSIVTLITTSCPGTVVWNTGTLGSTLSLTGLTATTTYSSICVLNSCTAMATSKITVNPMPTISVDNQKACVGSSASLTASNCTGIVQWHTGASGSVLTINNLKTTTSYTATCTLNTGCQASAVGTVTVNPTPTITANSPTICSGSIVTLITTSCPGTVVWNTGTLGSTLSLTGLTATTTYSSICVLNSCTAMATSKITVNPMPTISVDNQKACVGSSASLTASNCTGIVQWHTGASGSVLTINNLKTTTSYTATCTLNTGCQASAVGTITVNPNLTISANNQTICSSVNTTLTASGCLGSVLWNTAATGSVLTVTAAGTYSATCENGCGTNQTSSPIIIQNGIVPSAPLLQTTSSQTCLPTILTATGCSDHLTWSTGATATSIQVNKGGTYSAHCSNNCGTSLASNDVIITQEVAPKPPKITANKTSICKAETATITATECIGNLTWSTGATTTAIQVSSTGTYYATCSNSCGASSSSLPLTILVKDTCGNNCNMVTPIIAASKASLCYADSSHFTATGCNGIVIWSTGQSGEKITIKSKESTISYTAVCHSLDGQCISDTSNEIIIAGAKKITAPTVTSDTLKNTCPLTTVDLNNGILNPPTNNGGIFEFHVSNQPNSPMVTNPKAIGAGSYYIIERSSIGCYSDAALIKVAIKNCDSPILASKVDISVKKTGSSHLIPVGQKITYKIIITNYGTITASNIVVRDTLPNGLTYDFGSGIDFKNGVITKSIDLLKSGDSTSFTYTSVINAVGKITNKAILYKVDQTDSIAANNSSEWIINDPLSSNLLGLSKVSGEAIQVNEATYDIPFTIYVTNMGENDVYKLQVSDDLAKAFTGAKILSDTIQLTASAGLVVNPTYTGRGTNTNLLIDSLSSIPKARQLSIHFVVRVDLSKANIDKLVNYAELTYSTRSRVVIDKSQSGINPDPDGDGDPSNNSEPSPIQLNLSASPIPLGIGVALSISDTTKNMNSSYDVTYRAIVNNLGNELIKNVQIDDTLTRVFTNGTIFSVIGSPKVTTTHLTANPNFDGINDVGLLLANNSHLTSGESDSVTFTVRVFGRNVSETYLNNVVAKGIIGQTMVSDISNDGSVINANDNTPTPLTLPIMNENSVIIPEGFSPNGDGKNDFFTIQGPKGTMVESFKIYNRWGNLIFQINNKELTGGEDTLWNGKIEQSLISGELPNGTYFYQIKLANELNSRIKYFTITK